MKPIWHPLRLEKENSDRIVWVGETEAVEEASEETKKNKKQSYTWCKGERWCQVWSVVCSPLLAQIYCHLHHHSVWATHYRETWEGRRQGLRCINNVMQTGAWGGGSIFRNKGETLIKEQDISSYRINPLLEIISAWQSLTVSPLRLSSSPLTQRFPERKKEKKKKTHSMSSYMTMQCLSSAVT